MTPTHRSRRTPLADALAPLIWAAIERLGRYSPESRAFLDRFGGTYEALHERLTFLDECLQFCRLSRGLETERAAPKLFGTSGQPVHQGAAVSGDSENDPAEQESSNDRLYRSLAEFLMTVYSEIGKIAEQRPRWFAIGLGRLGQQRSEDLISQGEKKDISHGETRDL